MTTQVKPTKIRAVTGVGKLPDGDLRSLLHTALKGLTAYATIYSKPPVALDVFQSTITAYEAAIPAALDGSKAAVAQKNKLREAAIEMYTELAHYVEAHCNREMATFLLSGFQAATATKASPQPLDQPTIVSLVPGPVTGQMKLKPGSLKKAASYGVRFAPVPTGGGTPSTWTEEQIASKKPTIIRNLTPGTLYTFQIRALGLLGYTNWSDAVNRIAT